MAGLASNAAITLDSRIISGRVPTTVITLSFFICFKRAKVKGKSEK
jgi:hypothetical protein